MEAIKVTIKFTVDDEKFVTHERTLTPTEILKIAGVEPSTHYLVEIRGKEQISYEGRPNEEIRMHEHAKFVSVFTGQTPVS